MTRCTGLATCDPHMLSSRFRRFQFTLDPATQSMTTFEDIGLREELLRALEDEDISAPTALQDGIVPALRRGGNIVARASTGSGKTLAYTLGILDRVSATVAEASGEGGEAAGPRILIIPPTLDDAESIALAIIPYGQAVGFTVAIPSSTWGTGVAGADILVAPIDLLMGEVRSAAIKLDAVEAVILDDAGSVFQLGGGEQLDAMLDLVPRDAQRVVIASTFPADLIDLIDRRVKKALRYPAEPAVADTREIEYVGTIGYVIAPAGEKLRILAGQLAGREGGAPPPILFCRTDERAADLAEQLAIRGFVVGQVDEVDADVAIAASDATRVELIEGLDDAGQTISYDVPADSATLLARHNGDDDAVILVEPRQLAHLKEIARQAAVRVNSTPLPVDTSESMADLARFRDSIRQAIDREDLTAQLLVLGPLFDEYTAAEVAAAVSALLRAKAPPIVAEVTKAATPPARKPAAATDTGPAPVTWARLFISIGSRDEVRPGDIVGAIAGEADIPGSRIGKIEIRDSFSIVEVQADVADEVIRAVNGTTLKGRSLRVDYDRGGPARRPPTRSGPPRRTIRRPPNA